VREDDPTGLAAEQDDVAARGGPDAGPSGAPPGELPRETQAGL